MDKAERKKRDSGFSETPDTKKSRQLCFDSTPRTLPVFNRCESDPNLTEESRICNRESDNVRRTQGNATVHAFMPLTNTLMNNYIFNAQYFNNNIYTTHVHVYDCCFMLFLSNAVIINHRYCIFDLV